jgi:poly(hydroxyalkanoate) depolymerase family esterase
MPKSLSSLWLKSMRRVSKAQQAQQARGLRLFESLLPKAVPATKPRRPKLKLVKPAPARPAKKARRPTAAQARAAAGLPGTWRKAWFSVPADGPFGHARRMLYWLYLPASAAGVPDTPAAPRPLVVMLHGCKQTAADFAAGSRMNALAERKGFAVLYPQQSATADAHRCWHWYRRDTQRGEGDVELIAAMIAQVQRKHGLDTSRTYVAGLSAGAALAAIVALRHPELVAAVGMHSAPVFGTTHSPFSAYRAMQHGSARLTARRRANFPVCSRSSPACRPSWSTATTTPWCGASTPTSWPNSLKSSTARHWRRARRAKAPCCAATQSAAAAASRATPTRPPPGTQAASRNWCGATSMRWATPGAAATPASSSTSPTGPMLRC